jgi:uncharacterized alpha-E superfamily protein
MLSRTADHLYWMARYIERAENTARMLDVNLQTVLLPQNKKTEDNIWEATLSISNLRHNFQKQYEHPKAQHVLEFMTINPNNPSSIFSCLQAARENARAVRGTLTTEVWETHNTTWLELQKFVKEGEILKQAGEFFEWVKHRSHLSRGVTHGTMLRDESFHFIGLGCFLERADNTARLLDVKYHNSPHNGQYNPWLNHTPTDSTQGDYYHWAALLRSVSSFETYRKVYRDTITPTRVAELLILRGDMPRSLLSCINNVNEKLNAVANQYSSNTLRYAGRLQSELQFGEIEDILMTGLHAFLINFLQKINLLGNKISRDFLVPLN